MSTSTTSGLQLTDVAKHFGTVAAVDGITFEVASGETVAILGPSGCGKSTVLLLVAGLLEPDRGRITWDGQPLDDVPAHLRQFGLMFQDFALFPHLSVFDNVAFGLRMARASEDAVQSRVGEVLGLVGLEGFSARDPMTLSGGEQQRVALARALAPRPRLLMLDEPLGSLDRTLRERLLRELPRILDEAGQTAIYVTHDQEEAFAIGDRVVLMRSGKIEQTGTPVELYRRPASPFAARFFGLTNILEGELVVNGAPTSDGEVALEGEPTADRELVVDLQPDDDWAWVATAIGRLPVPPRSSATAARPRADQSGQPNGGPVDVLLRPDSVLSVEERATGTPSADELPTVSRDEIQLEGIVEEVSFRGAAVRVTVLVKGTALTFAMPSSRNLPDRGARVVLHLDPNTAVQLL